MITYQPAKTRFIGMRGLGAHVETDPVTGEQRVVMTDPGDAPVTTTTVTPSSVVYQDASGKVIGTANSSTWIPGVPNLVTGAVGGLFGVILLGGLFGGRR